MNDIAESLARRAQYGCSQLGDDQEHTRTILANFEPTQMQVEGGTLREKSSELYKFVMEIAEGRKARNEINNFQGMAIFKTETTL